MAFSFTGEKRDYVAQVAGILAIRFGEAAILYDKYHEAEFGRDDLGFLLPDLYHDESDLVVAVFCPDYEHKEWCGLEWRAIFDLVKTRRNEQVMLCRFDHAKGKGIYSTAGFVDLDDKTPELAATRILERLALNENKPKDHYFSNSSTAIFPSSVTDFRAASSRLSSGSDLLIGREEELKRLDAAWNGPEKKNVVTIVAWGGVGKTSLVARWAANTLAKENHGGIERYFDWSFYSQGARTDGDATGADKAASADIFVKEALEFFGDHDLAPSNASAWQKGERLARLVAEHRALLILDGLEPLQDAKSGDLRDEALRALLRGLAADHRGLCLVTTRQQLPELNTWHASTAPEWKLEKLSKEAGGELLKKLRVNGTSTECEQLAADVKGHALTLTLLGKYLAKAHDGDIRKRDLISLTEADYEETSGHAFYVMEAYERWLENGGRFVEVAILRLLGLFDRPATPNCLTALRSAVIPGLTDTLAMLTDAQWNLHIKRLVQLGLIEEQRWEPRLILGYGEELARSVMEQGQQNNAFPLGEPQPHSFNVQPSNLNAIEAHPLIREYFGRRLREHMPHAWLAAHSCLSEHLQASVPYWPEGLEGLQPLYQAVAHGCQAGLYQEMCLEVYHDRILRGTRGPHAFYSERKLGAMGANLAAMASFFVVPWTTPATELTENLQAWLLGETARFLRDLGRLSEAREPMRTGLQLHTTQKVWLHAAVIANNLSELDLTLGDIASAVQVAEQCVIFADQSGNTFWSTSARTAHADALHQAGLAESARTHFDEAEAIQRDYRPEYPLLYSLNGFLFCDLLMAESERAAWHAQLEHANLQLSNARPIRLERQEEPSQFTATLNIEQRVAQTLQWSREHNTALLDIALDQLTLGRIELYHSILKSLSFDSQSPNLSSRVDDSVRSFRQAGKLTHLLRGLLTSAWLRSVQSRTAEARADLEEAQQIAKRGPMRLHLADVHLHRARLFFRDDLAAAREDLKQARTLIEQCGYLRRMPELEDAEKVILAAQ